MPAESKAQQRYMAIAEHNPSALRGPMPKMTHQQLHDFAATKVANKPEHVGGRSLHPKMAAHGQMVKAAHQHLSQTRPGFAARSFTERAAAIQSHIRTQKGR